MANTFDDIENRNHRTVNRARFAISIREDNGEKAFRKYMSNFDEGEQKRIALVMAFTAHHGDEEVTRQIQKDM